MQYYINLTQFERIKMVPQPYALSKTCFGVSNSNHALFQILNKAVLSMSKDELQGIIYMNTVQEEPFSIGQFIKRNPVPVILVLVFVFVLILLTLLIFLRQRAKSNKAVSLELQKHMRLFAISNELFFEFDYKKKILMISNPDETLEKSASFLSFDLSEPVKSEEEKKKRDCFLELLNTQKNFVCEKKLIGLDEKWHWFKIALETICDDMGEPIYAIGKLTPVDEEHMEKDELLSKAQRDSLTQLYNIESCLAARKPKQNSAFLLLDIDYFKQINDTLGHLKGDGVLCRVAGILQTSFREEDVVGRPGGDEFIVFLSNINSRQALSEKCAALCKAMRQISLDSGLHLSVSLGAAFLAHTHSAGFASLYQMADEALYIAKGAGRDQFKILPEDEED